MKFLSKNINLKEFIVEKIFAVCSYLSILTTILIIYILATESFQFFKLVSITDFLFGTHWEPLLEPKSFGVLPLLFCTIMIVKKEKAGYAMPLLTKKCWPKVTIPKN